MEKRFYVEIKLARDRAEFVTDGKVVHREQLKTVTRERIAVLEAMEPRCGDTRKSDLEAGRNIEREFGGSLS